MKTQDKSEEIDQPVSIDKHTKGEPSVKEKNLTVNQGDVIADKPQNIQEKAKQIAVDSPDITGDWIKVPTYFIVEYPNGEKKALHHVKDAKEISDVIRQARVDENGNRIWW